MRRLSIAFGLVLFLSACPTEKQEAAAPKGKVSSAAKDFLKFAKHGEVDAPGGPDLPSPAVRFTVARNQLVPGERSLRRLEIEVPLRVKAGELEATLREASRGPDLGDAALLEVWAYPDRLRHLCGAFGLLTVARDGKGVPHSNGLNERLLIERKLGAELDLDETQALFKMDAAAGAGGEKKALVAAGIAAGLSEERTEALLEKIDEHYPRPPRD